MGNGPLIVASLIVSMLDSASYLPLFLPSFLRSLYASLLLLSRSCRLFHALPAACPQGGQPRRLPPLVTSRTCHSGFGQGLFPLLQRLPCLPLALPNMLALRGWRWLLAMVLMYRAVLIRRWEG